MVVTYLGAVPLAHHGIPLPQSSDLGVTASTYASFAEIMTGFSFGALAVYLAYERSKGSHSDEGEDSPDAGDSEQAHRPPAYRDLHGRPPTEVGQEHPVRRDQV